MSKIMSWARATVNKTKASPPAVGIAGVVGGLLLLGAANVLLAKRAERRNPAQGEFLEVEGARLHYLDRGEGQVVVLIHGNMVDASDFAISGLLERLAENGRVIAFDRPGFGHSPRPRDRVWTSRAQAELLWKALGRLNVERPVVLGHSFGSLVALNLALEHPEGIAGLVLMSGYYHPTPRPDIPLAAAAAIPILGDLLRFTISPLIGRLTLPLVLKAMFSPREVTQAFRKQYPSAMVLRPSALHATGADALNMAPDAAKTGGRKALRLPILIVSGREDRIVSSRRQSERLAGEIPGARLLVVEGAGHMVHHTATTEVFDELKNFMETIER